MAETLERSFLRALSDIDELFPPESKSRELFIRSFTTLVTYFVDQPLDSCVPMFFVKAGVEDRRRFALNIADNLRLLETGPQRDLWNRWLSKYFENRLNGTPAPLDPSEAPAMLNWLVHLHDLFPEAVDLAIKIPKLPSGYVPPIHALNKKGTAESHPEATAKLLIYWVDQDLPKHVWLGGNELIENLLDRDLPKALEERLKEIPAELGF